MQKRVAMVTRTEGHRLWVDYLGEAVPCGAAGRNVAATAMPGDEVEIVRRPDTTYEAVRVLPRRGGWVRLETKAVANVDQVLVVRAAGATGGRRGDGPKPAARPAGTGRVRTVVVLNKCDLVDPAGIRCGVAPLVEEGQEVVLTSAVDGLGLAELRSRLEGRLTALVGEPGAGKTSLLEALYPGYGLRERAAEVRPLPGGGYLAL